MTPTHPSIPNYALYGVEAQPGWLDMVHFEHIHERSTLYHFDIAPHVHDGLVQLLYLTAGGGEVLVDGARWSVRSPALILIPTRHVHGFHFTSDVDGPVVTAAQRPLESLLEVGAPAVRELLRQPLVMELADAVRHVDALLPLFEAIERESRQQGSGEASAGTALLMAVFVQVARLRAAEVRSSAVDANQRSRKAVLVDRFRALVDAHFRQRWPIEAYADALGLSAGQLTRLCQELLGHSSLAVVNARTVHDAERELVYSTLSIKQIAAVLGFADEAYFGRFFKKQTGRTPSAFREAARHALSPAATMPGR